MQFIITLIIAIIPVFFLCAYIYHEDKYEKESIPFLIFLFVSGTLCYVLSAVIKNTENMILNSIFSPYISYSLDGMLLVDQKVRWLYNLLLAFMSYSITDVILITLTLFLITFNSKQFNSLFDGIVYAVYVIMGFTFVEVTFFGYLKGWDLLALKCLTTLPMRMLTGTIMGYHYTKAKIYFLTYSKEKKLQNSGNIKVIKAYKYRKWILLTILLPWIIWGFFEYALLMDGPLWRYLYYIILISMYFYAIRKITNVSNNDRLFDEITKNMIDKKYNSINPEAKKGNL